VSTLTVDFSSFSCNKDNYALSNMGDSIGAKLPGTLSKFDFRDSVSVQRSALIKHTFRSN
jgi:hypothetical protein